MECVAAVVIVDDTGNVNIGDNDNDDDDDDDDDNNDDMVAGCCDLFLLMLRDRVDKK